MLSLVNANIVPAGTEPVVYAVALMFGGLAQLIAGIICLRNGNVFAGVLFSGFGAFWLSLFAIVEFFTAEVPLLQHGHALGLFLYAFGVFAAIMSSHRSGPHRHGPGARAPGRRPVHPGCRELHRDHRADQDRRVGRHALAGVAFYLALAELCDAETAGRSFQSATSPRHR